MWLKFTSRNCACRSSSSSFSLVLAYKVRRLYDMHPWHTPENHVCILTKRAYFIGHHVQEGIKHFICDGNHTLHHTWNEGFLRVMSIDQKGPKGPILAAFKCFISKGLELSKEMKRAKNAHRLSPPFYTYFIIPSSAQCLRSPLHSGITLGGFWEPYGVPESA